MKKVIFSFVMIATAFVSNAQDGFSKGSKFLSGNFGISSSDNKDEVTKTSSFSVNPSVGYFISDNLAVGVGLGIGSNKVTVDGDTESESSTMSFGGFGRYYFSPKSKFTMFGHLGVNYNSSDEKVADFKTTGIEAFVAPGFNYWISNKLALEAVIGKIGYSTSKADFDGAESSSNFDFGLNLSSISFGMVMKF
jgi:hypothetical protein